ncbi:MAG: hypothetical protein DWP98_06710 [Bacteroidetes bacterium]|nr:MAG: hypothetical protein DWP98_06710 [Bacteroidota bacterium]MBL1145612.1 hypothetical protein [Bacteroidota bacterium]NOG58408.1 hypothetical protein [Bacteroidota bacterium]
MRTCILIGGTGRSGSNVLKEILSHHPESFSLFFEPRYILDPDGVIDFYESFDNWSAYNVDYKLRRLFKLLDQLKQKSITDRIMMNLYKSFKWNRQYLTPPKYYQWELDKHIPGFSERVENLKEELKVYAFDSYWAGSPSFTFGNKSLCTPFYKKEEVKPILSDFIISNIQSILDIKKKDVFIDDSTFNILHASTLLDLIPVAKMIHIYRHPLDVVGSLKKQNWAPKELHQVVSWYKSTIKRWQIVKSKIPSDSFIEIKFEDLIYKTHETINLISDFTGEQFIGLASKVDLSKHNIGNWENLFSKDNQAFLIKNLEDEIRILGYN